MPAWRSQEQRWRRRGSTLPCGHVGRAVTSQAHRRKPVGAPAGAQCQRRNAAGRTQVQRARHLSCKCRPPTSRAAATCSRRAPRKPARQHWHDGGSGSAQVPLTQRGRRMHCPPTSRRRLRGARRGGTMGAKRAPPCERRGSRNSGIPRTAGDPGNTSTKYPVVPPREVKTKPGSDPANTAEATCWRPPGQGGATERPVVTDAAASRRGQRAAFSAERPLPS